MSTNQVVMLHIALSTSRVGSLTYYLPVLVADEDDDEENERDYAGNHGEEQDVTAQAEDAGGYTQPARRRENHNEDRHVVNGEADDCGEEET